MSSEAGAITTAAKVAWLRDVASYSESTRGVRVIETHWSWVFLTDHHAYKLKKAMRYDHLDLSTPSARLDDCVQELRLNRRLAPAVYLDVVPLVLGGDGRMRIGPCAGTVVDWLVKMRRLAEASMLDSLLRRHEATAAHMRAVAARLCAFYATQPRAPLTAPAYRALLLRYVDDDERELIHPAWALPAARIEALCAAQRALVRDQATMFDARVQAGRVVEGHGDLRPEHVYLGEPLAIIDRLEFSAELRMLDTADELGFLALECERAGEPALGRALLQAYGDSCADHAPAALLHFYQSCRARTRARLAIAHLKEAQYRDSPKWPYRARRYLARAMRHMRACRAALSSLASP